MSQEIDIELKNRFIKIIVSSTTKALSPDIPEAVNYLIWDKFAERSGVTTKRLLGPVHDLCTRPQSMESVVVLAWASKTYHKMLHNESFLDFSLLPEILDEIEEILNKKS